MKKRDLNVLEANSQEQQKKENKEQEEDESILMTLI
jgi:hypothetical protein